MNGQISSLLNWYNKLEYPGLAKSQYVQHKVTGEVRNVGLKGAKRELGRQFNSLTTGEKGAFAQVLRLGRQIYLQEKATPGSTSQSQLSTFFQCVKEYAQNVGQQRYKSPVGIPRILEFGKEVYASYLNARVNSTSNRGVSLEHFEKLGQS